MVHIPTRMCVICRERFLKTELLRYVVSSKPEQIYDEKKIMSGRGWYVCTALVCREKFKKYTPGMRGRKGAKR